MSAVPTIIKASQTAALSAPVALLVSTSAAGLVPIVPKDTLQTFNGSPAWGYQAPWQRYNAIRNPEMMVVQRGTSSLGYSGGGSYGIDGWAGLYSFSTGSDTMSQITVDIPADTSGNNWYPHITYALRQTCATGTPTPLAPTNQLFIYQPIEGLMAMSLKGGPTSISFLVRSSITGTFTVSIRDSGNVTTSYTVPVTIPTANVWQRVTIPNIPAFPSGGVFSDGTSMCYYFTICLLCGSTYTSSTDNAWVNGNFIASSLQTNFAVTGATFDFTAVQHEPNPVCTPYIKRDVQTEFNLNYRYLWILQASFYLGWVGNGNWTADFGNFTLPVPMRAGPTLIPGATYTVANGAAGTVGLGYSYTTLVTFNNPSTAWSTTTYNSNYAILNNAGLTAEL